MLEIVRREFFNQTPQITDSVSKPDTLGNITISLNETDADGDTLLYTATNGDKGTVALNPDGHSFTYTPNPGETGTDTITVTANDDTTPHIHGLPGLVNALSFGLLGDRGNTATATITVKLNTPPTLTVTAGTPDQSTGKVTLTAVTTDADGDPLTLSVDAPDKGSVSTPTLTDPTTGTYTFTYTPTDTARHAAAADSATPADKSDTVTVSVNDGHGGTTVDDVAVTIAPKNAAPEETSDPSEFLISQTVDNGAVVGVFNVTDDDNDAVTYKLTTGPTKGTAVINGGGFIYTPTPLARFAAGASGATAADKTDSFTVTVDDGHGGKTSFSVNVTVYPEPTITVKAPIGEAISSDGFLLYVTNENAASVSIVDLNPTDKTAFTVIKTIPTGDTSNGGPTLPYSATLSPDGKRLYVTNFFGHLTIIDTDPTSATYQTVLANVPAGSNPYFEAISPDGNRLYVTGATGGVSIIDTDTSSANYGKGHHNDHDRQRCQRNRHQPDGLAPLRRRREHVLRARGRQQRHDRPGRQDDHDRRCQQHVGLSYHSGR